MANSRTQNGIVFDNINLEDGILKMPLKISQTSTEATYKLLDAVNIDWNDAYLPNLNASINDTGDLLKLIDEKISGSAGTLDDPWENYTVPAGD